MTEKCDDCENAEWESVVKKMKRNKIPGLAFKNFMATILGWDFDLLCSTNIIEKITLAVSTIINQSL